MTSWHRLPNSAYYPLDIGCYQAIIGPKAPRGLGVAQPGIDEALMLLRRALAATEESLAALSSLDQLQDRFETAVLPLIEEPELWAAAQRSQDDAKQALLHARGCMEEMISQVTSGQAQETQARAWADQIVDLNERLQASIASASQQATLFYESIRPTLIAHYLRHSTKMPRWADTWPKDVELATRVLERIARSGVAGLVEHLDVELARLRWEVGWPQQRIAAVAGLSQPSVAARLARVDTLVSLEVGAQHIRRQADREQLRFVSWHVLPPRGGRSPTGEMILRTDDYVIQLEVLVAAGETGVARRGPMAGRAASLDYLRLEFAERRQRAAERALNGVAVYLRDRGTVGYYTAAEVVDAVRRFGSLPAESLLQSLRETLEPAWTIADLLGRAERPATDPERPEA